MALIGKYDSEICPGPETEIVARLQRYLNKEDMVILIDTDGSNPLTEILCRSEIPEKSWKRAVILSAANFPRKPGRHSYQTVSEKEMNMLLKLYRLYEASDKLFLLSDSKNYGSIWNYVNSGLISEEEMLEALFL